MAMITDRSAHGFLRSYLCSSQALFWVVAGTQSAISLRGCWIGRIALGSVVGSSLSMAPC